MEGLNRLTSLSGRQVRDQIPNLLVRQTIQQPIGHDRVLGSENVVDIAGEHFKLIPLLVNINRFVQVSSDE